ncbi:MAG TPA: hypothetical protein VHF26_17420 [Trebonia sp.]|nr:hypothetical protein [Trebonia sp.]
MPARPSCRLLGACVAAAGVVLAAGCSAAPPSALRGSVAVGPVQVGAAAREFAPFPQPEIYTGLDNKLFYQVQKPKTGTGPRQFRITLASQMVFWLNCIGKKTAKAQVSSPGLGLKYDIFCGDGTSPGGITFAPKAPAVGHPAVFTVTVTKGAKWEIRVDELAGKGIKPPPDAIPKRTPSA